MKLLNVFFIAIILLGVTACEDPPVPHQNQNTISSQSRKAQETVIEVQKKQNEPAALIATTEEDQQKADTAFNQLMLIGILTPEATTEE